MIDQRKIKKAIASAVLLCFTSLTGAQPLYAIPANTQLPEGFNNVAGSVNTPVVNGNVMNIHQNSETAVNQWTDFSIGADATVNFTGKVDGFNSLNYVTNGPISEIYGQLTALGGNIFIANPAGVQIGNSAQINVGSIYVTNKDVSSLVNNMKARNYSTAEIESAIAGLSVPKANAELMSLGSIIAENKVTFDGGRIVVDTDRLYNDADANPMKTKNLAIRTTDKNDVILGYTPEGYDGSDGGVGYANAEQKEFNVTAVPVTTDADGNFIQNGEPTNTPIHGYMWVRDLFQLQNMNTKLDGWYALRNSIDASYTASEEYNYNNDGGKYFKPIGSFVEIKRPNQPTIRDEAAAFSGRFDGLNYDIFALTIDRDERGVGLFGHLYNAYVRNVTINSGSIHGDTNVGSIAGSIENHSIVENIINTADVSGSNTVGGIIGTVIGMTDGSTPDKTELRDMINIGTVSGTSVVGGILGTAGNIIIDGTVYNLGNINGNSFVGGIVGSAYSGAQIGDGEFQIYNSGAVTGDYNVGGIVGSLTNNSSVTNVAMH